MNNNGRQQVKDLVESIITSYDTRLKIIKQIIKNTHQTLEEFRKKREGLSKKLQDVLAGAENLRRKDFDIMMGEVLAVQAEKEDNIKEMLVGFQKEEEQIVEKLKSLSQKESISIKDFKKTLASIKNTQEVREKNVSEKVTLEIEKMRQEIGDMLAGIKKEREKMGII
ncbi:hypothetical protein KKG58_05675 [Patescibacteria group bacterium]|nr:hypothetical protein [Patescibacteria group bacterium]